MSNLETYNYNVQAVQLMLPDKSIINLDPIRISDIELTRDYDNYFFPIFKFTMVLSADIYYTILENKTDIKIRIRMQYRNSNKDYTKLLFNEIFSIYIDNNTPDLNKELRKTSDEVVSKNKNGNLSDFGTSIELYLFREDYLTYSNKIINKIIKSGSMLDTITFLLYSCGIRKNVLMENLDNRKIYSEILIPPLKLIPCLAYLENQFGFFNTYTTFFFDINYIYLLSKKSGCNVWRKGEVKTVVLHIFSNGTDYNFMNGSYYKDNQYHINVTKDSFVIESETVSRDAIEGTNRLMINNINGDVNEIKSSSIQRGSGNYKVVVNKYDNPFLINAEKNNNEDANILSVKIVDYDILNITPNKEFKVIFEDSKLSKEYGGIYRLTSNTSIFAKEGTEYTLKSVLELRKRVKEN